MNQLTLMTRKEAQQKGLKRYFTGKPCKRGHIAERHVSNKSCLGCQKGYEEGREEYHRNYREAQKLPCDLQEFYCLRLTPVNGSEPTFFKAGITTNLKKRINNIKSQSNHSYLIEVVDSITLLPSGCNPAVVEALFHSTTDLPRYDPQRPFKGSTGECYSQQPDILLHAARCLEWYAKQNQSESL